MIYHVYPVNDLQPHDTENGSGCDCDPSAEVLKDGDLLIVHHSFDGREGLEIFNHILKKE